MHTIWTLTSGYGLRKQLAHLHTLALEIMLEIAYQLQLLFLRQTAYYHLQNSADGDSALSYQAAVVDVCENTHKESVKSMRSGLSSSMSTTYWQSMRSVMPPCPGMLWPKSLMLNARLKPEAKKPPKGATSEANTAKTSRWKWYCVYGIASTGWRN